MSEPFHKVTSKQQPHSLPTFKCSLAQNHKFIQEGFYHLYSKHQALWLDLRPEKQENNQCNPQFILQILCELH